MNFKTAFLLALLLHIAIIGFFVSYVASKSTQQDYVQAYVVKRVSIVEKNLGSQTINQQVTTNQIQPQLTKNLQAKHAISYGKISSQAAGVNQKQHDQLILLLHNKIQSELIYPEAAKLFNKQGVVTVEFLLHSDGMVDQLKILKTSRYSDLDTAAIETIEKISPVIDAVPLLRHDQNIVINVEFY